MTRSTAAALDPPVRSTLLAPGLAGGLAGGAAMAAWMIAAAALEGMPATRAFVPIGRALPAAAELSGAWAALLGLALHLLVAAAIGVVLATLMPRGLEPRFAAVMGGGYAFGAMGVMTSYVLPAWAPAVREAMPALGGSWVLAHAAYGAIAGPVAQALRRRARAEARPERPRLAAMHR